MTANGSYHLKGHLLGACNCDWGCPCNFERTPNYGSCEGVYLWQVDEGHYNGVDLSGIGISEASIFPAAIHLGNGTSVYLIDERASEDQRPALENMIQNEAPFRVFLDLTTKFIGFRYVPFEVKIDGINSYAKIPGKLDFQLTAMKNPVTGEDEMAVLTKPTGFTSQIQELCTTSAFSYDGDDLSIQYPGKYAEFCPFEYSS
ncbi:MAG TPA: DUF1326 domain-containing protein [Dehalococcoidia bacterium]|nr:DUF1326 domain-containing protein [Dehalococcoidia bacterium]